MKVAWGYGSDARIRGENQDAFGVFELPGMVLGIVCDGVGGHAGGAQASTLAVRALVEALHSPSGDAATDLQEAIAVANRTIYEAGRKSHRLMGMATTIVAVAVQDDVATIAHVGDSRAYMVRDGVARAMTRDHTMVNMFVDNELLSPEDAESHPEAHVLARSLGSERRVDVEIQHGIHLQDGDVILLCSDGVHGVLKDAELASPDWKRPATAARALLVGVANHQGTDNATVIGFRCGGRGEPGMTATPLPSIEQGGDALTPSSHDLVHAASMLAEPLPPALYPVEPEDEPTAHADDHTEELIQGATDERRDNQPPGALPPKVQARTSKPTPTTTRKAPDRRRLILLIAGLASAICIAVLLFAVAVKNLGGTPSGEVEDTPIVAVVDPGTAAPIDPGTAGPGPTIDPGTDTAGTEPLITPPPLPTPPPINGDAPFYSVHWEALRRDTKTPRYFSNPLPNPKARVEHRALIERTQGCSDVVRLVETYLDESGDYAPLWHDTWNCFKDVQQPRLMTTLTQPFDFNVIQRYLEGEPTAPAGMTAPYWSLPPTDGIELRMELFTKHSASNSDEFENVVLDFKSRDIVAAEFTRDLRAEIAVAQGFKQIQNPNAVQTKHRARRVYIVRRHLDTPVGKIISDHDPSAYWDLKAKLKQATNEYEIRWQEELHNLRQKNPAISEDQVDWRALAVRHNVPEEVAHALLAAAGRMRLPNAKVIGAVEDAPVVRSPPAPEKLIPGGDKKQNGGS